MPFRGGSPSDAKRCTAKNRLGLRCQSWRAGDSQFCNNHGGELAVHLAAAADRRLVERVIAKTEAVPGESDSQVIERANRAEEMRRRQTDVERAAAEKIKAETIPPELTARQREQGLVYVKSVHYHDHPDHRNQFKEWTLISSEENMRRLEQARLEERYPLKPAVAPRRASMNSYGEAARYLRDKRRRQQYAPGASTDRDLSDPVGDGRWGRGKRKPTGPSPLAQDRGDPLRPLPVDLEKIRMAQPDHFLEALDKELERGSSALDVRSIPR